MEKSRLGISLNLFAALLYFLGMPGSVLIVAVAAGYVLFFEENITLKKTAVKALILTVFFSILTLLINYSTSALSSILNALNYLFSFSNTLNYSFYSIQSFLSSISFILHICMILIMVMFGFSAYKQKEVKIKWIDNIIDKHF